MFIWFLYHVGFTLTWCLHSKVIFVAFLILLNAEWFPTFTAICNIDWCKLQMILENRIPHFTVGHNFFFKKLTFTHYKARSKIKNLFYSINLMFMKIMKIPFNFSHLRVFEIKGQNLSEIEFLLRSSFIVKLSISLSLSLSLNISLSL